ncbi:VapE domain-containing protein [Aliiruegeria sabulilitoris]|uniref:VapE domain-containing protein n=1 Tax=Aliiruegeria sabulilitoris TaxID=1510458 RepID=UPI0008329A1D|nr:VapE domain-containing protein [Aliiruegeria sabulilitoris]
MTTPDIINNHKIVISVGGTDRGRVTTREITFRKLVKLLSKPSVDAQMAFAQYMAIKKAASKRPPPGEAESQEAREKRQKADDRLMEIKASAGYIVAGKFKNGRRRKEELIGRSCIQIDIDNATPEQTDFIIDGFAEVCRYAFVWHTTRSHCPERPRVRILVPLSKMVDGDTAHALTRLLSLLLADDPVESIEIPDLVSFRPAQIMYLPSVCKDQEFKSGVNEGDILDPDEFLAEHPGWEDISTLPKQAIESSVRLSGGKMEDPREKPGLIGAFCRAYSVEEVIENWLDDIYSPGESTTDIRYTYVPGSGSNGAVVYDDGLFLHSNHGTDPIEGSANAWDLLRIHKFGHLDEKARSNTSPGNMPSYKAMQEFAERDKAVQVELASAYDYQLDDFEDDEEDQPAAPQKAKTTPPGDLDDLFGESETASGDDLDDLFGEAEESDSDSDDPAAMLDDLPEGDEPEEADDEGAPWAAGLRTKKNLELEPVIHNIRLICENDPRIAPAIAFNEFTQDPVARRRITSKALGIKTDKIEKKAIGWRRWEDGDDIAVQAICSAPKKMKGYEVEFPREKIMSGVYLAAKRNSFHPVKEKMLEFHRQYVESGRKTKGMLDQMPQKFLGCPDDAFHQQSSRYYLLGLVARTFEPGCKFDCVPILRGTQGGGKGRFWKTLSLGYHKDLPNNFERVDKMVEAMRGTLIGELGEMAGLRKDTAEIAKAFITTNEDQLRLAYAKREGLYPRRGLLSGTSNLTDILHDPTGNRRFWIWVDTHNEDDPIDIDGPNGLKASLPGLYGEAVDVYLQMRAKQPHGDLFLDLQTREARKQRDALADQFRARSAVEDMADMISDWLDKVFPASEVMLDASGMPLDKYADDESPMVRNMTNATMVMEALKGTTAFSAYRNADRRTFGKALSLVEGWSCIGQQRRHGTKTTWYVRGEGADGFYKGPLWRSCPWSTEDEADSGLDDLIG